MKAPWSIPLLDMQVDSSLHRGSRFRCEEHPCSCHSISTTICRSNQSRLRSKHRHQEVDEQTTSAGARLPAPGMPYSHSIISCVSNPLSPLDSKARSVVFTVRFTVKAKRLKLKLLRTTLPHPGNAFADYREPSRRTAHTKRLQAARLPCSRADA